MSMRIVLTPAFAEKAERLLGDEDWPLIETLAAHPERGKLIPHGGGLRKIRVALPGRGKRGGGRVIYYWRRGELLFLLDLYAKNERTNLSAAELKGFRRQIEGL
ncbi:MAG: type II toxin-antitoxin system RelE/ParE family toxin [Planctomycetota bacterium]|nr:type II toxin-antitoxin system RelE/ParE family toxin [Planctomycetota bacterium]